MATSSASSATAVNNMNFLRLSGLASGMDTESMVKSLMKAERTKYDKLAQQKQRMEWQDEANLEINNLMRNFKDTYLSVLHPETSMLSSSLLSYKVTADSTASAVITANANAFSGSHVINSITSLATGANTKSTGQISASALSATTALKDLALTNPLTFVDGKLSFAINGKAFEFKSTDTLQDVINTVNAGTTATATMSYSSLTGKITLASKTLGSASTLTITNITGNAFADTNAAFSIAQGTVSNGTDAVLNIDGVDVTKNTNNFTIDGITYRLKSTTSTANNFTVEQDVDSTVDKIKSFVDAYNTLVEKLQDKLDEKRDSDYQPLTDDQKAEMSDAQIEQWETRAKAGMLNNDQYISKLLSDMRNAFFQDVTGGGTSAVSMGFGTISYLTQGQITLDETKLRKALNDNPQQVAEVLSNISYETDISTKYKESGVFARINNSINGYLDDYSDYRKDSRDEQYERLDDSMERMEDILKGKEERYWTQFTRMEQYLSQMNSQSQWLSQQFSGSGS